MNKLSAAAAAGVALLGLSIPAPTLAVRYDPSPGLVSYTECREYYTTTPDVKLPAGRVCYTTWVVDSTGEVNNIDMDSMYDWGPMGGGGSGWSLSEPIKVTVWTDGELYVNKAGTKASATNVYCSSLNDTRYGAAQVAATAAQVLNGPFFQYPSGHEIMLMMPNGESQTFVRVQMSGSFQYAPKPGDSGVCKKR